MDRHEICVGPGGLQYHARACTLNAVGVMVGVPPHELLVQGHELALEIRATIGPLGEFAIPTEIAIREAVHDIIQDGHDLSRHCFTVLKYPLLKERILRVMEVTDDGDGGHITGVFEIDHRETALERRRSGGFDIGEDTFAGSILVFHSVVRGSATSCHCYTFELPEKIQLLSDFKDWTNSLETQ